MNSTTFSEIELKTVGENKITKSLLPHIGNLKWTNKYDIPKDYTYNEEGWVEVFPPLPKVTVQSPLFLPTHGATKATYLLHNLLALRILNNKTHEYLLQSLISRDRNIGVYYTDAEIDYAREESLLIVDSSMLPKNIHRSILRMDTLWSNELGRAQINSRRVSHHISDIREDMPISSKYKTPEVVEASSTSLYAVKHYWKEMGWNFKDRTKRTIIEALLLEPNATPKELEQHTKLSLRTIYKYLPEQMIKISENNGKDNI